MSDFIDFETAVDDDDFDDNDAAAALSSDNEDYYAFTNLSRSVNGAMQNSFLDSDRGESRTAAGEAALETSNYCYNNYDPAKDEIDEFRDFARLAGEF